MRGVLRAVRRTVATAALTAAGFLTVGPVVPALAGSAAAAAGCPSVGAYGRMILADHPAVFYPLTETAAQGLCDGSGNALDGSYATSGLAFDQPGPPLAGSAGAITADGTVQPAVSRGNSPIRPGQSFTVEGWFRAVVRQREMVIDIGQTGGHQMAGVGPWTAVDGTGSYVTVDMYEATVTGDTTPLGIDVYDGDWHYVAGSYDAVTKTVSVYVDGRSLTSAVQEFGVNVAPSPVRIGWWVDRLYNQPFNGSLADVAVYPTALSAPEIAAHGRGAAAAGPAAGITRLPTPAQAFGSVGAVLASVAIAAAGTAFVAFPAELFNLTFEENYATIMGWWQRLWRVPSRAVTAIGRVFARRSAIPKARTSAGRIPAPMWRHELPAFALVVVVGALLGSLLDPRFGVNVFTVELFAGIVLAILAGMAVAGLVADVYHRRGHGPVRRRLRAFPLGLGVAAVCVALSRLVGFEPGYLYGVVCGIAFDRALSRREAARVIVLSTLAVLAVSILAWFAWVPVHHAADEPGSFPLLVVLDDFLAALFVAGIIGSTIGLLPLRFLPGAAIRRWNTWVWLTLFGVTLFALVDFVVRSPDAQLVDHSPLWMTIALFATFAATSVAFREYFAHRWRLEHGVRLTGIRDFFHDMIGGRPGEEGEVVSVAGAAVAMIDEIDPDAVPDDTG